MEVKKSILPDLLLRISACTASCALYFQAIDFLSLKTIIFTFIVDNIFILLKYWLLSIPISIQDDKIDKVDH